MDLGYYTFVDWVLGIASPMVGVLGRAFPTAALPSRRTFKLKNELYILINYIILAIGELALLAFFSIQSSQRSLGVVSQQYLLTEKETSP